MHPASGHVAATPHSSDGSVGDRLLVLRGHLLVELLLDDLQVEAGTLLHRRELECALGEFSHFLLNIHKAPELLLENYWQKYQ